MSPRKLTLVLCTALITSWLLTQAPLSGQDKNEIRNLIKQLGNGNFNQRKLAGTKLMNKGQAALPYLNHASKTEKDPEAVFRINELVNAIVSQSTVSQFSKMKLSLIEPGEFQMGSLENEADRQKGEIVHKVKMTSYYLMGKKEVTQKEFNSVMDHRPSWFSPQGKLNAKVKTLDTKEFPVDSVSWYDAIQFCNKLSEKDEFQKYYSLSDIEQEKHSITRAKVKIQGGTGYRLPTEAEWEYACRAGTESPYHFGKQGRGGNFQYVESIGYGRSRSLSLGRTTKTGSFKPNAWGLYDMHGNVAEWCWDWYSQSYYSRSPAVNPGGPPSGVLTYKVLRGGSFLVKQSSCRSATRYYAVPRSRAHYQGFRVARNVSEHVTQALQGKKK